MESAGLEDSPTPIIISCRMFGPIKHHEASQATTLSASDGMMRYASSDEQHYILLYTKDAAGRDCCRHGEREVPVSDHQNPRPGIGL